MLKVAILSAVIGLLASNARAETMICIEEVSGGLKFIDGSWQGTRFKIPGTQYVVASNTDAPSRYTIKEIGKEHADFQCERGFYEGKPSEQMVCGGLGYGMIVNFKNLRFTQVYTFGYIEDDRSGGNTPFVTGGKCSTINP